MESLELDDGEMTPDPPVETDPLWDKPPSVAAHPELEAARGENQALLARLRTALAATIPGLEAEAIAGGSLTELEASFAAAQALAAALRNAAAREHTPAIPLGAPGRATYLPATPLEKIRAGLGRLAEE